MRSGVRRIAVLTGTALVVSLAVGVAPSHAAGQTWIVDSDSNGAQPEDACTSETDLDCSLPQALVVAGDGDRIEFGVSEVKLPNAVEVTQNNLVIDGGGGVTIGPDPDTYDDGFGEEAIGVYANGVTIQGLTIAGFEWDTAVEVREGKSGNTLTRTAIHGNWANLVLEEGANHGLDSPGRPTSTESGVRVRAPDPFESTSEITENDTYTLELFACREDNEGEDYLSTQSGVARGQAVFFNVGAIGPHEQFSATATDEQTRDTSEFSNCSAELADDHPDGFPAPADTAQCEPGSICTATPPDGSEDHFSVSASGGNIPAELFAELNGGPAPECGFPAESDLVLSPDWVRFGFDPPTAGQTWTKDVTITSLDAMDAEEAAAAVQETQVCYTAPYQFDTRPGYPALAGGPEGIADFYGILPDCVDGVPAAPASDSGFGPFGPYGPYEGFGPYGPFGPFGPPGAGDPSSPTGPTPGTPGPCVRDREVVQDGQDFFTQITFRVPAGELDPQGRSARRRR
ncbi:MAG TPA: hypothetical protein VMZ71_17080 [Gemmataceae bacterium]|nr:hypothetical protein [Gemmataceae bacterium]